MEETAGSFASGTAVWRVASVGLLVECWGGFKGLLSGHWLSKVICSRLGGFLD